MSIKLSEEEMRRALFGSPNQSVPTSSPEPQSTEEVTSKPHSAPRKSAKLLSQKLRVTLSVTKEFEGSAELFVYDVNTLSSLVAELEAKKEAKKLKFNYYELIAVKAV